MISGHTRALSWRSLAIVSTILLLLVSRLAAAGASCKVDRSQSKCLGASCVETAKADFQRYIASFPGEIADTKGSIGIGSIIGAVGWQLSARLGIQKQIEKYQMACQVTRDKGLTDLMVALKTRQAVSPHCGEHFEIPPYNSEYTLAGLCALQQGIDELTTKGLGNLPPTQVVLSRDENVFSHVSKDQIKTAVSKSPRNEVIHSEAPLHGLMVGNCSPDYESLIQNTKRWLSAHR